MERASASHPTAPNSACEMSLRDLNAWRLICCSLGDQDTLSTLCAVSKQMNSLVDTYGFCDSFYMKIQVRRQPGAQVQGWITTNVGQLTKQDPQRFQHLVMRIWQVSRLNKLEFELPHSNPACSMFTTQVAGTIAGMGKTRHLPCLTISQFLNSPIPYIFSDVLTRLLQDSPETCNIRYLRETTLNFYFHENVAQFDPVGFYAVPPLPTAQQLASEAHTLDLLSRLPEFRKLTLWDEALKLVAEIYIVDRAVSIDCNEGMVYQTLWLPRLILAALRIVGDHDPASELALRSPFTATLAALWFGGPTPRPLTVFFRKVLVKEIELSRAGFFNQLGYVADACERFISLTARFGLVGRILEFEVSVEWAKLLTQDLPEPVSQLQHKRFKIEWVARQMMLELESRGCAPITINIQAGFIPENLSTFRNLLQYCDTSGSSTKLSIHMSLI